MMRRTNTHNNYYSRARNYRYNDRTNYRNNTRQHHYSSSGGNSFGIVKLREIIANHANNPNVLLLCLQNEKTLLSLIADDSELKGYDGSYELLRAIMEAFAIVCDSDPDILLPFITEVCGTDFHVPIINYLLRFPSLVISSTKRDTHINAFHNLAKFVHQMQSMIPQFSREKVKILLISFNDVLKRCNIKGDVIRQSTVDLLNVIKSVDKNKLTDFDDNAANVERMHALLRPPNNFREMSIYPTHEDIHGSETPFLRSNIIKGKYFDVDHYLDVQFRLLREDYVRPLREGIGLYLTSIKENKNINKLKDIRVYPNVRIVRSELRGELIFAAKFDASKFVNINWQTTKRLIYGSMLCLSADNFQTFCFATVAGDKNNDRNAGELSRGIVWIKFETQSSNEEFAKINPLLSLTMIESQAYFEAYRYNLQALQSFNSENFPLQDQLIRVSDEIKDLRYLSATIAYDLTDLAYPLMKISDEEFCSIKAECEANEKPISLFDMIRRKEKFNYTKRKQLENVSVLDNSSWPLPEVLGFDESQFEAFKAALTKQMVIIQGPPGTGKTYIGLRIVQTLLRNSKHWNGVDNANLINRFKGKYFTEKTRAESLLFSTIKHKPILIVSYTNHALDQFLEGMVPFCRNIVRIGGRSKSDILDSCKLFNLKKRFKENRNIPDPLFSSIKKSNVELASIQEKLSFLQKQIEQLISKRLISRNEFGSILGENLWPLLDHIFQYYSDDLELALVQWLSEYSVPLVEDSIQTSYEFYVEEYIDETEVQQEIDSRVIDGECDEYEDNKSSRSRGAKKAQKTVNEDGFSEKLSKKRKEKFIRLLKHELQSNDKMSDEEVLRVTNPTRLTHENRWRLYRYWVQILCDKCQTHIENLHRQYAIEMRKFRKLKLEEDLCVIRGCDVIGMTTTGAAKFRPIIEKIDPTIVVIEEAAEVLESHVITSLTKSTNHLILIGDHRQLKPNPNVYELAKQFKLDVSLFERMINNGLPYYQLKLQHRMRPCISSLLVPHFYAELNDHKSVRLYGDIKGIHKKMFFVNHNELVESYNSDSKSKYNPFEAQFIVNLCKYLVQQDYKPSQITIIVMYSAQLFKVKNLMKDHFAILNGVHVTVVDNYQGEENDIILISFVRSNIEGCIGFLQIPNRVNVALSRAKMAMYCIGNFDCLAEQSKLWTNIKKQLEEQKGIGSYLNLFCQNHPDIITKASKPSDFSQVPDGGCTKPCAYRLNCGHLCPKACHAYDPEHEIITCPKICDKPYAECAHKCKKICHFSDSCDPCPVPTKKLMPVCGHEMQMKCSDQPSNIKCTEICERILPCDHKCTDLCGNACDPHKCNEWLKCFATCGHLVDIICKQKSNPVKIMKYCKEACDSALKCGHKCGGSCGRCHQNRLHIKCREKCERLLVCGHTCEALCGDNCPPCRRKCENACIHKRCERKCGELCEPCLEPCIWQCEHRTCSRKCSEKCDRDLCSESCKKALECGHLCVGICGEQCPNKCHICNKKELENVYKVVPNARFIQLEDCKHVVELNGMIKWLSMSKNTDANTDNHSYSVIQMIKCPKCDACVRKTKIFNDSLHDIEVVKKKFFGNDEQNEIMRKSIADSVASESSVGENIDYNYGYLDIYAFDECDAECENKKLLSDKLRVCLAECAQIRIKKSKIELHIIQTKLDIIKLLIKVSELLWAHKSSVVKIEEFEFNSIYDRIAKFLAYIDTIVNNAQQISDSKNEMNFFHTSCELIKIASDLEFNGEAKNKLVPAFKLLFSSGPFTDEKMRQIRELVEEGVKQCGECGVTLNEKKIAIKTMSLRSDDWFKCANGHVFCVGECGGQCPQCCDTATVVATFIE